MINGTSMEFSRYRNIKINAKFMQFLKKWKGKF
jgi:hypothetical protein